MASAHIPFGRRTHRPQAAHRRRDDRGQAVVFVAVAMWIAALLVLVVALVGARALDEARAQAGADAVALAGAVEPDRVGAVAAANEVEIVATNRDDGFDVAVQHASGSATARARRDRPDWEGLDPALQAGLRRAEALLGERIVIVSGLRTHAEQQALWDARHTNPYPVARPGTSDHELGLAVDVPLDTAARLAPLAALTGVCQPLPIADPVHFVLCRTTPTR